PFAVPPPIIHARSRPKVECMHLNSPRVLSVARWIGVILVLLLPALAGGYSTIFGWPQAALILTVAFALQLTDPVNCRRLPAWYFILVLGLTILGIIWMLPGEALVSLSPARRNWPGPDGQVSGIAADRSATLESLVLTLGFCSTLGLGLIWSTGAAARRLLIRLMLGSIALVIGAALAIQFVRPPFVLFPDVSVLNWDRLSIPFTGPNLAAAFFAASLPFAVGSMLVFSEEQRYLPSRRVWQLLGLVLVFALFALQIMTRNRAMWVALVPAAILGAAYLITRRSRSRQRLYSLLAVTATILLLGLFLSLFDPGRTVSRFMQLPTEDASVISRPLIWQNAWNTFREYPLVGVGLGGFGEVCPTTSPPGIVQWPRYAHCEPLQWLAETGLAGTVLLCIVLIGMFRDGAALVRRYRHRLGDRLPFLGAVLLLLLAGCIDFPFRCPALLFLFALFLGTLFGRNFDPHQVPAQPESNAPDAPSSTRAVWPAKVLATLLILLCCSFAPAAWEWKNLGFALAHFERQKRHYVQDHDAVAMTNAAEGLLIAAHGQSRWSGEALQVLISSNDTAGGLERWRQPVEAVLAQCPYHDTLYFFEALVVYLQAGTRAHDELELRNLDLSRASELNTRARAGAATNVRTLREIVTLDFAIAQATIEPELRRMRMVHAQASARWLLTIDPRSATNLANYLQANQLPFDDLLPCYPDGFGQPNDVALAGLNGDRPLTAQQLLRDHDLNARTDFETAVPQPDWPQIQLLLVTGRADDAQAQIRFRFKQLSMEKRSVMLRDAIKDGWGVLSRAQYDTLIDDMEHASPSAGDRYLLGLLYYKRNQWDMAELQWRRSFDSDHSARTCAALAQLYAGTKSWQLAADYAMQWTQIAGNDPNAWRLYAFTEFRNKNYSSAKIAFARYRTLAPDRAAEDYQLSGEINLALKSQEPAPSAKP
ncbi:MAG TPA: O-antigen ligase family protein, partial [Planctomycetota bacterium]|nr:O-antigen ligase family protein [Planctomycetota bacterium]